MNGIWLVSYVVLWLLVLGGAAVVLLLAREIETLHARLDAMERHKKPADLEKTAPWTGLASRPPSDG